MTAAGSTVLTDERRARIDAQLLRMNAAAVATRNGLHKPAGIIHLDAPRETVIVHRSVQRGRDQNGEWVVFTEWLGGREYRATRTFSTVEAAYAAIALFDERGLEAVR